VTVVDIFIIVVLLASILIGAMRGLVREVVSLVFWIAAIWSAWAFAPLVEPYLGGLLSGPHIRVWVARLIIFVVVLCIGGLVGFIMGQLAQHSGIGWLDRVFGMMFGFARGMVLLGMLGLCGELLELQSEPWWHRSVMIPYCVTVGDWLRGMVGEKGEPWSRLERLTGVKIKI
jgi:membrane protein required for colicin V production